MMMTRLERVMFFRDQLDPRIRDEFAQIVAECLRRMDVEHRTYKEVRDVLERSKVVAECVRVFFEAEELLPVAEQTLASHD